MKIVQEFDYQNLTRNDGELRTYNTPLGKLPSITTILSAGKDMRFLESWRARIGDQEADRITKEAGNIGTYMHETLEFEAQDKEPVYTIKPNTYEKGKALQLAGIIKAKTWPLIKHLTGNEVRVYSYRGYAGTADIVGRTNKGTLFIADYKNSRKMKKDEWIGDYKLQCAALAQAHNEMYVTNIAHAFIPMVARDGAYKHFCIMPEEMQSLTMEWNEKVKQYNLNES